MPTASRRFAPAALAAALACVTARPADAHHAFAAEFDSTKPVKLTGTVSKVELINPHSWIHIDVKAPDGTVETWAIEGGTPNSLLRRGITRESLKVGTVVNVDGYRAKAGGRRANGRDITLPDGRKLFMGSQGAGAPPK
jgi:hypothetical protein